MVRKRSNNRCSIGRENRTCRYSRSMWKHGMRDWWKAHKASLSSRPLYRLAAYVHGIVIKRPQNNSLHYIFAAWLDQSNDHTCSMNLWWDVWKYRRGRRCFRGRILNNKTKSNEWYYFYSMNRRAWNNPPGWGFQSERVYLFLNPRIVLVNIYTTT